jgi:DnaJ-domain-containing protein 1
MPDVRSGLVEKGQPGYDSFEPDAESLAAKEAIKEQTARTHELRDEQLIETPEQIRAAILAPSGIAAGLESDDDVLVGARGSTMTRREFREIEEQKAAHADEFDALADSSSTLTGDDAAELAARRRADEIRPAYEALRDEFDDQERAAAWGVLDASERGYALQIGLVDESELEDLDRSAAESLSVAQHLAAELHRGMAINTMAADRAERWQSLVEENHWTPAQANAVLQHTARVTAEAGLTFATMQPDAWEASVRGAVEVARAESQAVEVAQLKQGIFDAVSTDVASGLVIEGRPVGEHPRFLPKPDYSRVNAAAGGRVGATETPDEIRAGVLADAPVAAGIKAAIRGTVPRSDGTYEAAKAKAAALGIAL